MTTPQRPRPRPPDRGRSLGERLSSNRQQLLLGGAAVLLFAGLVVSVIVATSAQETGSAPSGPRTIGRIPLTVPLDLEQVGFEDGLEEITAFDEGPGAVGFCNQVPDIEGLIDWTGSRLTESGGSRRVAQMVVRFQSSVDAARFVASNSNTKDCEMWEAEGESQTLQFSVVEQVPTEIYGDETRQFTVQATSNGPDLFLRIATIRSGPEVLQFTVVSANRQDLALLDDILADTAERLGY